MVYLVQDSNQIVKATNDETVLFDPIFYMNTLACEKVCSGKADFVTFVDAHFMR